jgi:hypothetical protein
VSNITLSELVGTLAPPAPPELVDQLVVAVSQFPVPPIQYRSLIVIASRLCYIECMNDKDISRFWNKVDRKAPYECWPWLGKARCGKSMLYGQFWLNGKNATPHRISYQLANQGFDFTLHVLHKCDNPICVNPSHLFLGTNSDNIRDKMNKGRWKGGHPKFIPRECVRCKKFRQIVKNTCRSCYTTIKRQQGHYQRNFKGFPHVL